MMGKIIWRYIFMSKTTLAAVTGILMMSGFLASAQQTWKLPPVSGNPRDGWAAGPNFKYNPFRENGAIWSLRYQTAQGLRLMKKGLAYKFNMVFRNEGDNFDPPTMYINDGLKAAGSGKEGFRGQPVMVLFTPDNPMTVNAQIAGVVETRKGAITAARIRVLVLNAQFVVEEVLQKEIRLKDREKFTWNGPVTLKNGQSLALELQSIALAKGRGAPLFLRKLQFKVGEVGGDKVKVKLPVTSADWRVRDEAKVKISQGSGGGITLQIPPGKGRYIIDGPEIVLPHRDRFTGNRAIFVSAEAWPEKKGDTVLQNYAMQIRARLDNGMYTRSLRPRRFWDTTWELADAGKMSTWTLVTGKSALPVNCTRLTFEIVVPAPRTKNAMIHLRNISVQELFTREHIFTPKDGNGNAMGHIFFADCGAMKIDFVDADKILEWRVEAFDELNRPLSALTGKSKPPTNLIYKLKLPGFYKIVATAEYAKGVSLEAWTTAAVVGPPLPDEVRMHSRFGLNRVHGNLALWKKSGARWEWGIGSVQLKDWNLSPDEKITPPSDWKEVKDASGLSVLAAVNSFPGWLFKPGVNLNQSLHPPRDWNLYARLFEAFARANPQLTLLSSYNEGNAKWRGSRNDYIRFQTAMARGVHRGNPKCKVVGPGDYSINLETFADYVHKGMFKPGSGLDGVNIHAYVRGTPPEAEFIARVEGMTQLLKQAGLVDIPVYLSEFGWTRGQTDWQPMIPPHDYSNYVARSMILLSAQEIDSIIYFCFLNTSTGAKDRLPGYSLLYADSTPTPGYVAYVNTVKWLARVKRGDGRWFRISPRINLMLGKTPDGTVGAAWTTRTKAVIELPGSPLRVTDLMGRPLKLSSTMEVSPSPIFFALPMENTLFKAKKLPTKILGRGAEFLTELDNAMAWDGLTVNNQTIRASVDAVPGHYLVQGRLNGVLTIQPVIIPKPLVFKNINVRISPDNHQIDVVTTIDSSVSSKVKVTLKLDSDHAISTEKTVRPEAGINLTLPLGKLTDGKRINGNLVITTVGKNPYSIQDQIDTTVLLTRTKRAPVDWRKCDSFDFSAWNPSKGTVPEAADCSAALQTAVSPQGFRLRVKVSDNVHRQTKSPAGMWMEDSIQVAFDMDAGKPWEYNLISDGRYNGHRIVYYSIGQSTDGKNMVWRNRANCPGMTGTCLEPSINAVVTRQGRQTLYDVTFPWPTLGAQHMPSPESLIGFSLAVNDSDKGFDRKFLTFGNGIVKGQVPELFAKLFILPE